MEIVIHLPERSEDYVSESLRELTKRVCETTGDDSSGGLGGEYGYGANFVNDTFTMHRYCWCDRDKCLWCNGDAPHFRHKATGASVRWYKYIGRGMEVNAPNGTDWAKIFTDCFTSLNPPPAPR